jgi:hypothetical protein
MKNILLGISGMCLLSSCSYTSYEYINNRSGKDVEVIISPALPDSIALAKTNHFEKQGVVASVNKTSNEGKYVIKNKGYLRLGIAYDEIDRSDLKIDYLYINKGNGDTLFYETSKSLVPEFKQASFTVTQFVKEPKKKTQTKKKTKKGSNKKGGWVYTVKKPKVKK